MLSVSRKISPEEAKEHRVALGVWLKELREGRSLSQRDLSERLGLDYYTFISQLENGRGKIPSSRYLDWATALGCDPQVFVRKLLMHYEPEVFEILFPDMNN